MRKHSAESDYFGDILQIKLMDHAATVPLKVLAGMQWATMILPSNYLYSSMDDDIAVHVSNTFRYLKNSISLQNFTKTQSTDEVPIICMYSYQDKDKPSRNPSSKWYTPYTSWKDNFWPVYCRGGMYVMSLKMVKDLFVVSRAMPLLSMDDVWITGIMRKKLGKGDGNILAAPFSRRNDILLHQPVASEAVLIEHMWGNTKYGTMNIAKALRYAWEKWTVKKR